jgi:hypothetical protein
MTLVPAILTGILLRFIPVDYYTSYLYNIGLDEKSFQLLEEHFYSAENIQKLVGKLQEQVPAQFTDALIHAKTKEHLKAFISFEVLPTYLESMKITPPMDIEELQKIQEVRGTLLVMRMEANSRYDIEKIASACRENFEQTCPLYSIREELINKIIGIKENMADIEQKRFTLDLMLKRKHSTLEKLQGIVPGNSENLPDNVVLQVTDMESNISYLPLPYQIQASRTQIINLEEQVRANQETYNYYLNQLKFNQSLLEQMKRMMSDPYTLKQYHVYLTRLKNEYQDNDILDYLSAYIKYVENKMDAFTPLIEKPKTYILSREPVKTIGFVLIIAFFLSVFAAFVREGLEKSRN